MALTKVDTTQIGKDYLERFLEVKDSVLSTYLSNIDNIHFVAPGWETRSPRPEIRGWKICHLLSTTDDTRQENINLFDFVQQTFQNVPSHSHIISSNIIETYPSIENIWSREPHKTESGFKRYCIPLQMNNDYLLDIIEDDNNTNEYEFINDGVYEFENTGNETRIRHTGDNTTTGIVWVVDVIENSELTQTQINEIMIDSWETSSSGILWDETPIV